MAKGKKKDKKKDEVPSMASLSLSDQPSTSQPQQQPQKDESVPMEVQAVGDSKPQEEKPQTEAVKPQEVASSSKVSEESQKRKDDDDDEYVGLGLGGGKKRRKKKKPDQSASATTQSVPAKQMQQPAPMAVPTQEPATIKQSPPNVQPVRTPWGAGPKPGSGPPPGYGAQPGSGPPAGYVQQPASGPQLGSGPPPGYRQQPGSGPQPGSGSQLGAGPPPGYKQQPGSGPPSGYGRGRGQAGRGFVPSEAPTGPSQVPTGPSRVPTVPSQVPTVPSQVTTAPSQAQSSPSRDTKRSQGSMCLYKIPDKILGRTVPCRMVKVQANYLEMTIQPLKIHRYDVIFKPEKPKKFLPLAYTQVVKKHFGNITLAFDQQKNVYALSALPGVPANDRLKCEAIVTDANDRKLTFEVSFKFTGIVDLNTILTYMKTGGTSLSPPTEAIQAVDVILRQATLQSYVKAGRQFFKRPAKPIDLGDGLEMWTGLFQSAIFTSRPFVNIDVAHKGFPRHQMLIDAYTRDFRLDTSKTIQEQRGRGVEAFQNFLKGLRVSAYIGGDVKKAVCREFICNELVDVPRKLFFKSNEGTPQETRQSVLDYFEKEKGIRIRYPNLNCVWVGPRDKHIYYPMEFLQISYGQVCNKQMNEMQLSTLVRESATPPADRKQKIQEVIKDMNYSKSDYFKKFGLDIANQFLNVDARVLQPPKIDVGGTAVEPRRGVWQSRKLLKPQALDSWGMISVDTDARNPFDHVVNMIMSIGKDMGMVVNAPKMVSFNVRINELMRTLQAVKDKGLIFLFVIISARGRDYYHRLKRTAEREVGILTQCIKEFTATRKCNEQTIRNIMLKVNSKLMGINHALDSRSTPVCLKQGKVMLVGADVTHPSPDQSSVPSIAAVTASIDDKFTIYNITLSVQTPKKEMIVDFEDMMVEHLNEFEKRQRELPSKIFVFRDGVSEGQFAQVMNSELQAVHNAYKRKIGPMSNKRPEVLFLLVQKRHHTRFFLGESAANVEPGTVVDTHIVHPKELDFYLVSHQAIKGTARPTRYHAVCNDGRIAQDEVEQLTYYLCHLYARCTRAVSYPTPTYYAHLACNRARSLTFGDRFSNADLERSPQRLRVLERILETSRMFFV